MYTSRATIPFIPNASSLHHWPFIQAFIDSTVTHQITNPYTLHPFSRLQSFARVIMTSIGMALDGALEAVPAGVEAVVAAAAAAGAEAGVAAGMAATAGTVAETAAGLAAGMTPVGWIFTVSTVVGGLLLGGFISDFFDWSRKRGFDVANAGGRRSLFSGTSKIYMVSSPSCNLYLKHAPAGARFAR